MSEVIPQMQVLLEPARQRLKRLRLQAALVEALVLGTWVLPTTLLVTLGLGLFRSPLGILSTGQCSLIIWSMILCVLTCLALKCVRPLLDDPSWLDTAMILDEVSNRHNFIAIAYDTAQQRRTSLFARMAIDQGLATLEGNRERFFHLHQPGHPMGRTGLGLLATVILLMITALVPHVGLDSATAQGPMVANLAGMGNHPLSALEPIKNETLTSDSSPAASVSTRSASQSPRQNALQATLIPSQAQTGTSQSEAAATQQPFSAQSPSASAARAQDSPPSEAQSTRKKAAPTGDTTPTPEEENTAPPSRTRQKAGNSGAPDAESKLKASLLSGQADQDDDLDNEDDKRQDKEQKRALAGTGGQPLMADRLAAPSRELGMSGKKGDQPPEGRGGPSGQKKSRATATILSGMPVPVHVKGMKQQGKSKSQARAMPLGASDVQAPPVVTVQTPGQEGQVQRYSPGQSWQAVIDRYYQSLRQTESTPENK